jgi:hypothetical protein
MYEITYKPRDESHPPEVVDGVSKIRETVVAGIKFIEGEAVKIDETLRDTPWTLLNNPDFVVSKVEEVVEKIMEGIPAHEGVADLAHMGQNGDPNA